jgi:hypothetical protein
MNTQTNGTAVSTPAVAATLAMTVIGDNPVAVPIVNAKGTKTGAKIPIGKQGSYKQIRDHLRTANPELKGNALSKKVNEIFFGEADMATEAAHAAITRMHAAGLRADMLTVRKSTASITFRKPSEQVARGAKAKKAAEALLAGGVELSADLKAQLIEALSAKPAQTVEAEATVEA